MASEAVYKYLLNTNRPYSANDITLNLHKEFGKTAVQKGLDELVEKNKIREKVYGKQKVYCIVQDELSVDGEINVSQLDEDTKEKQRTLLELQKELNGQEAKLQEMLSTPTTADLQSENNSLKESNDSLRQHLERLTSGNVKLVTEEERNKVKKLHDSITTHQKKRKRMANDILDSILEGYPKSKTCLYEEIGIELDP